MTVTHLDSASETSGGELQPLWPEGSHWKRSGWYFCHVLSAKHVPARWQDMDVVKIVLSDAKDCGFEVSPAQKAALCTCQVCPLGVFLRDLSEVSVRMHVESDRCRGARFRCSLLLCGMVITWPGCNGRDGSGDCNLEKVGGIVG